MSNIYFRYFDIRMASAVTTNGQVCIRGVSRYIEKHFEDITNVYSDTDSVEKNSIVNINNNKDTIENHFNNLQGNKINVDSKEYLYLNNHVSDCFVDNKIENKKIKAIYRHKVSKPKWKITTDSGREVIVTNDHSIMIMRNNILIEAKPSDILLSDKVIAIKN